MTTSKTVTPHERIRAYLTEVGHWRPEFEAALAELIELRKARAQALARAQESPTVEGSKGQTRENPAWDLVLKFQFSIDRLSDRLLLNPKSANQVGIKADDGDLAGLLGD